MFYRYLVLCATLSACHVAYSSEAKRSHDAQNNGQVVYLTNGIAIPKSDFIRITSLLEKAKSNNPASYQKSVERSGIFCGHYIKGLLEKDLDLEIFRPLDKYDIDACYLALIINDQQSKSLQKATEHKDNPRAPLFPSIMSRTK